MGTIQVWDVGTGEKIADYPSPEQDIRGMLFTLDGTLMVAGSVRNRLIVSTADSGLITNAEYASNDFDIRIHTMNTGEMTTTLTGLTAPPSAVALSPDGLYLAATYGPEIGQPASVSVYVWNTSTSEIVYEIPVARQSLPVALAFSPDGRWLATTERKALDPAAWPIEWVNSVVVWDVTTGEQVETLSDESLIDQEERDYRWLSLLFSPDGRWIAALNEMGTVSVWQVASKEGISFKNFFAAPSDRILFSPDNKALVSAEYRGIVRVWDLMTASQRFAVEMDVFSGMFFMPDGSLVLQSMAYNVPARRYDLASGGEIVNSESQQMIGQIILSPDGTLMAINAGSGAVSLREAANGEMHGAVLAPHQVTCMAFSPDSTVLATGGSDDTIILWDTATRDEIIALAGETGSIFMLSFNRDGTRLISVSTSDMGQNVDGQDNRINNVIRTWDVATGELLMSTTFASLSAGVLSPDGHLLAITENNEDPDLLLIDSGSGDPVAELEGLSTFPLHLTFSSDSNLLAAAGQDGMIYVWDVSSEGGN
jgi:WD40 repeat protein